MIIIHPGYIVLECTEMYNRVRIQSENALYTVVLLESMSNAWTQCNGEVGSYCADCVMLSQCTPTMVSEYEHYTDGFDLGY